MSLTQRVVEQLSARIRDGAFRPGERLPTELVMEREFGVSRTVVREAISHLKAGGLVETRHGIGTFVLAPPPVTALLPALGQETTIRDVLDMLELRISLETEAAGLAAARRKDEHLRAMKEALDAFEANQRAGGSAVEADFQFHLQIASATGNRYFEEVLRGLGSATIPRRRVDAAQLASASGGDGYLTRTNLEHAGIYEAVRDQDPEAARAAMRLHLTNSRQRLRRLIEPAAGPAPASAPAAASGPA